MSPLSDQVTALFSAGDSADREEARAVFVQLRAELSAGRVRAAEPDAGSATGWRVNTWVKQGILLGFRWGGLADVSMDHGRWPFVDKDTLPLKRLSTADGVRVVPGGSSVRDGAYLARGVICMPPMYINIGAYVGEGTLVDSHALVGSCAQVGARVHLSAGAQIGGVIEPVGALPVIIEDDVLMGGNTGIYEGIVVRARAVIAAGTVMTGSTPTLRSAERLHRARGERAAAGGAGGGRRGARGTGRDRRPGRELGPVACDPGHREVPRRPHGHANRAGTMDTLSLLQLARTLVDIDSTTGQEGDCGRWLAAYLRRRGFRVEELPVSDDRFNVLATIDPPQVVLSTHFDCVPPFIPSREEGGSVVRAWCMRCEGYSRGADRRARAAAEPGRAGRGCAVPGGRGARKRWRPRRQRGAECVSLPDQRGADR